MIEPTIPDLSHYQSWEVDLLYKGYLAAKHGQPRSQHHPAQWLQGYDLWHRTAPLRSLEYVLNERSGDGYILDL